MNNKELYKYAQMAKSEYPYVIMFYEYGDYWVVFNDDAKLIAKTFDMVLTSFDNSGTRVPMCAMASTCADVMAKLISDGKLTAVMTQKQLAQTYATK